MAERQTSSCMTPLYRPIGSIMLMLPVFALSNNKSFFLFRPDTIDYYRDYDEYNIISGR